jgi:pyrroline-5-carboxylate reductase
MVREGERLGISYEDSLKLSAYTMLGSAKLLLNSGRTPEELIRQVSSPGGTTVAALTAFDDFGFEGFIREAFKRCVNRADELGGGK